MNYMYITVNDFLKYFNVKVLKTENPMGKNAEDVKTSVICKVDIEKNNNFEFDIFKIIENKKNDLFDIVESTEDVEEIKSKIENHILLNI